MEELTDVFVTYQTPINMHARPSLVQLTTSASLQSRSRPEKKRTDFHETSLF